MSRRLAVIGHPLAAEENRAAFTDWSNFEINLIVPKVWKARSLGTIYRCHEPVPGEKAVPGKIKIFSRIALASGRNSLYLWWGLGRLLRELKPDIIYCWEEPWCLSTWQVSYLARNLGVSLIFFSAENRPKILPWPFTWLQQRAFRRYASCIVPTAEIAKRIRETGYAGKVLEIPLWIRERRILQANPDNRCLAYVGRLIPLKRVHLLVEALPLLPGYQVRIIGDGPERLNLEKLANDLGLNERVKFYGHVDNDELENALSGTSLLVLPTGENVHQAEQFGKAALEGISCGLPVLASRTGNLAVLAKSFATLIALDLDSPTQLAEAVKGIWNLFPKPEILHLARSEVLNRYGYAAVKHTLETAFTSFLPETPTA